ncbi:MAG: type II secretion system protein N [Burkholderiales bacterium]|nr:type II secretion system protein N [Burkholderiales bacterium]
MTSALPQRRRFGSAPGSMPGAGWFRWSPVFAGLLIYLVFLIATLPAAVAARMLAGWTDNTVRLHRPDGTFWRGSADALIITLPPQQSWRLTAVDWDIVIWRLVKGEIAADIRMADAKAPTTATLSYGWGRTRLRDVEAALPANDTLLAIWPQLGLWQPGGQFRFATADFSFNANEKVATGDAELRWLNASTSLSKVNPLGDYRAAISASGDKADVRVTTLQGALQVEGNGAWSAQRGASFTGTARADAEQRAQQREELSDLLKLLGKEQAPGEFRLAFSATP